MDLSIVIVSWNTEKLLVECLKSIFSNSGNLKFEVIVVDNASRDGTQKTIAKAFPQVILIENKHNFGFAKANNQGIAASTGKYILALNPDTKILGDCLPHAVQIAQQYPEIGILGARHLNSDGSLQKSVRRLPTLTDLVLLFLKIPKLVPGILNSYYAKDFDYTKSGSVQQVAGSFMLLSRDMLEQIGLFDDKFFIWFEEVDLCKRARDAGWVVWYQHSVKFIHFGSQSFMQVNTLKKQKQFFSSAFYYAKKHHLLF